MINSFAEDVLHGLSAPQKSLKSKYFYDDSGSRIFQEIMVMPEYYLTDAEFEILSLQSRQIYHALNFKGPFNIVELGPGDGFKTFKLLEYLVKTNREFFYVPIDISVEAIDALTLRLHEKLPELNVKPQVGDYFNELKKNVESQYPSILLFLGGNIGNYDADRALELLNLFNMRMKVDDKLLIGFDLKKNPIVIRNAYDDPHGITKRFNINLLLRINRELGADFKIDDFDFYCSYDPIEGVVKSYLVSLRNQKVKIKVLNKTFNFGYGELIWTEMSKKYDFEEIQELAEKSNFSIIDSFSDCKAYFTDSLWRKL
ncbi:MAG: L-histidine N(alpha)-methyltransferase [Bacteroidota bacterium]